MYEQFRNELLVKLSIFDSAVVQGVISLVDTVATGYNIEKQSYEMITYDDGLPDVCKAYIVSRSIQGLSQKTLKLYQGVLTKFFRTCRKPLLKLAANDIRAWMYNYEQATGISKRTLELYREVLNGFFIWAQGEGWMPSNPMATIKPIKHIRKPRLSMDQVELEYIRQACRTEKERAIVQILYSTGCRISELSIIKKSDINWDKREVQIFGKGNKYRTGFLNAKAVVTIRNYLKTRQDDSEYLIVSDRKPHGNIGKGGLEKIIRIITARVKDKLSVPVTPHVFRHTTATTALSNGMPVQDVQRMLGHVNISTTMVYAQVKESDVKAMHVKCVV